MRNLKKVLSLTLALVMMLSMMTFAGAAETTKKTAADLTDIKDVVNKEAVSLLVDLKVVAGRDDGAFDPAGSLKRAEFA
ncbi:MAG: S-layer homology domain-containing protein, partial [Oscillospiraceae bacterium]